MMRYGVTDLDDYNKRKRKESELVYFIEWRDILLNLSFVTEDCALMCTPSTTDVFKRNDARIVADYIKETCGTHFCVVNVHEPSYDFSLFDNRVLLFPFPDHCAPRLSFLQDIVSAMNTVKSKDPSLKFFIHCKAGRGRSGTVLVAYHILNSRESAADLITAVNQKRSPDGLGISIPSQIRFLKYLEALTRTHLVHHSPISVSKLIFAPELKRKGKCYIFAGIPFIDDEGIGIDFDTDTIECCNKVLSGEFCIRLRDAEGEDFLRVQLHSDFLIEGLERVKSEGEELIAIFGKSEMEGPHHRRHGKSFPDDFEMRMIFRWINNNE
jgi:hypothetical protein